MLIDDSPFDQPECDRAQSCNSCKLDFPKDNPVVPDGELVIVLNERYEGTAKDSSGKFLYITVTNHLRRKFYCINKNCLLRRHLYFCRSILQNIVFLRLINCFIVRNVISSK